VLDEPAYVRLMQQTQNVPPSTFGAIDPQLFHSVATQRIPPGPGPQPESPGHAGREVATGERD
jgi:cytochrome o ubiquinol oxidase subunit 2